MESKKEEKKAAFLAQFKSLDEVPAKNKNSKGEIVVEQTAEEIAQIKEELSKNIGEEVAE